MPSGIPYRSRYPPLAPRQPIPKETPPADWVQVHCKIIPSFERLRRAENRRLHKRREKEKKVR